MKRIFLTIDTECHDIKRENQYIWGIKGSEKYGIEKIIEIADEFNIPLNFFVDIAEAHRYGEVYIKKIIQTIYDHGHEVYLHLHPNYTTGDDSRTFFWEYSYSEQKQILKKGIDDYLEFTGKEKCSLFRAGRYSASEDMYKALDELGISLMDLSYCCLLPKMCHIDHEQTGTFNTPVRFHNQLIIPNTRYIGFDYFGRKKAFNCDVSETQFGEFKDVIRYSGYENIILTMHSWDIISGFFFLDRFIGGDDKNIRKLREMIRYAKSEGFFFSDLESDFKNVHISQNDSIYNPVKKNILSRTRYLVYNFLRFHKIARKNKKYFLLYAAFYMALLVFLASLFLFVI